jgi:hypothetical protein
MLTMNVSARVRAAYTSDLGQGLAELLRSALTWAAGMAVLTLIVFWLHGEERLPWPGWVCSEWDDGEYRSGDCLPDDGYHFEEVPGIGRVAFHDIAHTYAQRQRDLDVAVGWWGLNNKERQEILDGRASVYDFLRFDALPAGVVFDVRQAHRIKN